MENQQPAGEAQNSQEKAWYKNWWGIIIAVIFLPYFLLYLMWAKTNWSKAVKIILTVIVVFATLGAMSGDENTTPDNQQKTVITETKNESQTQQAPQPPQVAFDIPSLIGKSFVQLKSELGDPKSEYIPNDIQKKSGITSYDAIWNKSGVELSVSYFDSNKPINYIFINNDSGTSNQEQLMELCNLKNSGNLKIIPQKAIIDNSKITGLHICTKDYAGEKYISGSENCK